MKKKRYSKLNSLLIHFLCRKGEGKKKLRRVSVSVRVKKETTARKNIYIEVERFKKENN